jgi:16S rRNA (cytidine1402-2'-O)-methyltransferase
VGTPIGNLGDVTYRAVETLKAVDFICAEDTRVTRKLLNKYEIKKSLVSCREHSPRSVAEGVVKRLLSGESCALTVDAGMPFISDPGEDLLSLCVENGIRAEVVPGPSAVTAAAALSGLPVRKFSFEGFLSVNKKQRFSSLKTAAAIPRTLIYYEAPHKLKATLADMLQYFGDRKISICREMTKIHEEVVRTTLSGALDYYSSQNNSPQNRPANNLSRTPVGEYTLVIEAREQEDGSPPLTLEDAAAIARELVAGGAKATDACKEAAKRSGFGKSELYALLGNSC